MTNDSPICTCGEINARHCPVHNEPSKGAAPKVWRFHKKDRFSEEASFTGIKEFVEYAAYRDVMERLDNCNNALRDVTAERDRYRAALEKINDRTWVHCNPDNAVRLARQALAGGKGE